MTIDSRVCQTARDIDEAERNHCLASDEAERNYCLASARLQYPRDTDEAERNHCLASDEAERNHCLASARLQYPIQCRQVVLPPDTGKHACMQHVPNYPLYLLVTLYFEMLNKEGKGIYPDPHQPKILSKYFFEDYAFQKIL